MFNQNRKFGMEEHYWCLLGFVKFGKVFLQSFFHAALENIKDSAVRTDFLRYINIVQLAFNGTMEWNFNVNLSVEQTLRIIL